jgi:hypothetical protein
VHLDLLKAINITMTPRFTTAAAAGRRILAAASSSSRRRQSSLSSLSSWQQSVTELYDDNEPSFSLEAAAHETPYASHCYQSLSSRVHHDTSVLIRGDSYSHHHHLVREVRPAAAAVVPLNAMTHTTTASLEQFIDEIPHWLWYRQRCKIPAGSPLDPVLQQCRYVYMQNESLERASALDTSRN